MQITDLSIDRAHDRIIQPFWRLNLTLGGEVGNVIIAFTGNVEDE
jgi:hypothetical protein